MTALGLAPSPALPVAPPGRRPRRPRVEAPQAGLDFLPRRLGDVLDEVWPTLFPYLYREVPIHFVTWRPLACAVVGDVEIVPRGIYVHQVLSHPQTALPALRFILLHELLHFVHEPVMEDGYWEAHPEAFWDAEEALGPDRDFTWGWLWANLGGCMYSGPDGLDVLRNWRRFELGPRTPWVESELQFSLQVEPPRRRPRRRKRLPGRVY